ncbi:MAG: YpdA family putative bacillithiol disulfide reductase [Gemmatimonadetes bacterium]|nr:YpdA family putative bacillithiol disulfide reductase [Gemmatimonadota bacterium]
MQQPTREPGRRETAGREPAPLPSVDLAIVGAGPCGIGVGAAARKAGVSAVLFDKGPLCSSLVGYPPFTTFFSTSEKLEIEGLPFVTQQNSPTRREALTYYRGVTRFFDLSVRQYETVEAIERGPGRGSGGFRLRTRRRTGAETIWQARAVVVVTGGFDAPNLLGVPGEDLPKVSHFYREAHPYWDQDVVVVGGRNSAVEASLELFRVGARVTLVHFGHDLDDGVKPWLLPDIRNRIKDGEVRARWRTRVVEILPDSVLLRDEDGGSIEAIPNDWVLALTGWKPDHQLLLSAGVPVDPKTGVPEHDPETMETPVPGLFIAGVLAAGYDANRIFIENGRFHGGTIIGRLRPGMAQGSETAQG